MKNSINEHAARSLGSSASYAVYSDSFDPSLLNPMPRNLARSRWNITGEEFIGWDVWHCHEATFLTENGLPIAGTLKFMYPSNTELMVESKSMKLYLNSFDMCKLGNELESAITCYEKQVREDLVKVLESNEVRVKFFRDGVETENIIDVYRVLDLLPRISQEVYTDYSGQGNYVKSRKVNRFKPTEELWYTNILRSRCRHTKQKDTGSALIRVKCKDGYQIDPYSLMRQIVSLREVDEFHEFCAEKLFVEIMSVPEVADCCVTLLYSRRGSLDINPVRCSSTSFLRGNDLVAIEVLTEKTQGQ